MTIKPEYMLMLEQTPHWGKFCLLLQGNGTELQLIKVEGEKDAIFYHMLGISKPRPIDLDVSATRIMRADPDMQLWLHGQWKSLADIADGLYSQLCEFREIPEKDANLYERALALRENLGNGNALKEGKVSLDELVEPETDTPKPNLIQRNPALLLLAEPVIIAPLVFGSVATENFGIPAVPYYIGTSAWVAIGFAGIIYAGNKITAYRRMFEASKIKHYAKLEEAAIKVRDIDRQLDALIEACNAVRESLLHAGIAKGMFPQEYGLR